MCSVELVLKIQKKTTFYRSIARGRDCLYIWSDAAALELSNGSNGWFRFILDGKLATMYSSGSPEVSFNITKRIEKTSHFFIFIPKLQVFKIK